MSSLLATIDTSSYHLMLIGKFSEHAFPAKEPLIISTIPNLPFSESPSLTDQKGRTTPLCSVKMCCVLQRIRSMFSIAAHCGTIAMGWHRPHMHQCITEWSRNCRRVLISRLGHCYRSSTVFEFENPKVPLK